MNIAIMNDDGEPELFLRASDFLDHWFWDMEKADNLSAYLDLVFRADDTGTFITSTKSLAIRWKVSQDKVRKLLRLYKNHRLITYERAKFQRVKITICIDEIYR